MLIVEAGRKRIPFHQIVDVRDVVGGEGAPKVVVATNETDVTIREKTWTDAVRNAVTSLIPAQPGTYALTSTIHEDKFHSHRTNVIAWAASLDGNVYPVTCEGVNGGREELSDILHPDGRVESPHLAEYETFEQWAEETEIDLRRNAAERASKAEVE